MSSDDCSKDMADKQSDNSRPQGENDPPQKPDESDPARAKKEAILDHILRTLTTRPWCTSTSKDERLSNLSVYFEFKQLLEDDKAILERIDAKKATTEGKLKSKFTGLLRIAGNKSPPGDQETEN